MYKAELMIKESEAFKQELEWREHNLSLRRMRNTSASQMQNDSGNSTKD